MARSLQLWQQYDREAIHDVFSPETTFLSRRGTWGVWGIVPVPDRPGDYVFLVTFGQSQGEHVFDESITEDGVLSWQSQPRQTLDERRIHDFIAHDERINTIHLFLRTSSSSEYTYFGPLGYLTHDATRERPVYFQWQILEWSPSADLPKRIGLVLSPGESPSEAPRISPATRNELIFTERPEAPTRRGTSTKGYRTRKSPNYAERDARNRALGLAGEELVVLWERERLTLEGRLDLAERVTHVSVVEGDSAGYDIRSFDLDGSIRHIEVKTTRGSGQTEFFVSANELAFSRFNPTSYLLYRLYEFDPATSSSMVYVESGEIEQAHEIAPTSYRVRLRER
jgi:hypothetical protein